VIDLHEGVLRLFEEAQHLGQPRKLRVVCREVQRKLRAAFRPREREQRRCKRLQRIARELRAARKSYVIEPLPQSFGPAHQGEILTRQCAHCGAVEELRAGLSRWQHITPHGACVPASSAAE